MGLTAGRAANAFVLVTLLSFILSQLDSMRPSPGEHAIHLSPQRSQGKWALLPDRGLIEDPTKNPDCLSFGPDLVPSCLDFLVPWLFN